MSDYGKEYWKDRIFEDKYYHQALVFLDYVERNMRKDNIKVFDYGCGRGYFVHAFRYFGASAFGYDISSYAVNHPYGLSEGCLSDIRTTRNDNNVLLCYDVLEHVNINELDAVMDELVGFMNTYMILSICMDGDSNFDKDKTHITKRSREWWAYQFTKRGLIECEVPKHFMFRDQILIFIKGTKWMKKQ